MTDLVRSVAKKLRYYFEIKSLEDGFDLSGINSPYLSSPCLKPKSTLRYDGFHSRSNQCCFSAPEIRGHLPHLDLRFSTNQQREKFIKNMVEYYLSKYQFVHPSLPEYFFMNSKVGQKLRAEALGFGALPLPTNNRRNKRGKMLSPTSHSKSSHISQGEAKRLISGASKLLAATEIKDEDISDKYNDGKTSAPLKLTYDHKARVNKGISRPKTAHGRLSTISKRKQHFFNSDSLFQPLSGDETSSAVHTPGYVGSGNETDTPKAHSSAHAAYRSSPEEPTSNTRWESLPEINKTSKPLRLTEKHDNIAGSVYVKSRSHVTATGSHVMAPGSHVMAPGSLLCQNVGSISVEGSCQTESVSLPLENKTVIDYGPEVEYRVTVLTGTCIGSSTHADVKITLCGEYGRSKDIILLNSKKNKLKFQKGKEDIFIVYSPHIGKLTKVIIGHDSKIMANAWYLEYIWVQDMKEKIVYDFPCNNWLSAHSTDGLTYRELTVTRERATTEDSESVSSSYCRSVDLTLTKDNLNYETSSTGETSMVANESCNPSTTTDATSSSDEETTSDDDLASGQTTSEQIGSSKKKSQKSKMYNENGRKRDDFYDNEMTEPIFTFRSVSTEADAEHGDKSEIMRGEMVSLHDAAFDGDLEAVRGIIDLDPHLIMTTNDIGWNVLHIAAAEGHTDVVKHLCMTEIDINSEIPCGYTAVHLSAMHGHTATLKVLCEMGGNVNGETGDHQTPLHLAAKHGQIDNVKWLVDHGADVTVRDNYGRTVLDLIDEFKQINIKEYFQSRQLLETDVASTDM